MVMKKELYVYQDEAYYEFVTVYWIHNYET